MKILGIDPGIDGAFFLLNNEQPQQWHVMPTIKKEAGFMKIKGRLKRDKHGNKIRRHKTEVDPVRMVGLLKEYAPDYIVLEEVGARTGQGVTSMFSFGRSFGDVRTAGAWLGCPLLLVKPQIWQRAIFEEDGDTKKLSVAMAYKIWPNIDLRKSKRSRKPHSGLCDAACLAEYGRRLLAGSAD